MAAKKCPNCNSDCPVASSSCKKCLHVFKSRKGSSNSVSSTSSIHHSSLSAVDDIPGAAADTYGRRSTGRITRSKPNFYDSLHVEEQMRQQKLLLRKQLKQSKSEEEVQTGHAGIDDTSGNPKDKETTKTGEPEVKKRRRGRPPGITGKKPPHAGRIAIHNKHGSAVKLGNNLVVASGVNESDLNMNDEDIMADITPEKALQYNIVLDEINRKWVSASWKVS